MSTKNNPSFLLRCRHCFGKVCHDYYMLCDVLKDMNDGRLKVKVYGDRYTLNNDDQSDEQKSKTSIRYVDKHRVIRA